MSKSDTIITLGMECMKAHNRVSSEQTVVYIIQRTVAGTVNVFRPFLDSAAYPATEPCEVGAIVVVADANV